MQPTTSVLFCCVNSTGRCRAQRESDKGHQPVWRRGMRAESGRAQSDGEKLTRPALYVEAEIACRQHVWVGEKSLKVT